MPCPNSLSQPPPIPTPSEGTKNTTSPLQPKLDERADHKSPLTAVSPTDPNRHSSFTSPTTVIPTSIQSTRSPQDLTAEGLLALTSQPLSHGGAWSSASAPPAPRAQFLSQATEKIYTFYSGDIYPKTMRQIADDKRWVSRRKNRENCNRIEAKEEHLAQQRERERWFKPAKKIDYYDEEGAKSWGAWEKKKWYGD
ncbi:uncharacterized protein EAE97_008766 [Botrytis byssoidea]|uniref:Uncharacterized protein n=1 Tax=Botrytis byssoidea TaxID=139641 RepID=A0A9P5ICJ3_9HELO|nr:uncharacterized protein EAE97_008766 [Botrytis byssoidea]KAF7932999.1 hypothetical protein EAE97_008766 [Botrytis byssoidea]